MGPDEEAAVTLNGRKPWTARRIMGWLLIPPATVGAIVAINSAWDWTCGGAKSTAWDAVKEAHGQDMVEKTAPKEHKHPDLVQKTDLDTLATAVTTVAKVAEQAFQMSSANLCMNPVIGGKAQRLEPEDPNSPLVCIVRVGEEVQAIPVTGLGMMDLVKLKRDEAAALAARRAAAPRAP